MPGAVLPEVGLYVERHEGQGPFLLLVHGMLSSRAQWLANLPALSAFCRPVVVELLGHARSPSPEMPPPYHPRAYVAAFEQLRQWLGAERWFICGQSFGAGLTLRYALTHPGRIIGQVFTNSASGLADAETVAAYRANAESRARLLQEEGHRAFEKFPIHPRHARRLPAAVKAAMLADTALHSPRGIAMAFRHTTPNLSVRDEVSETRVPTLLVCGRYEKRFAPSRNYAAAAIPGLETVDLDAGHAVNAEAADGFNEALRRFVMRHATVAQTAS